MLSLIIYQNLPVLFFSVLFLDQPLFTAPFLLFACMICFNFVIACRLYCFNVDVFVFGKKLLRAYVFLFILHAELK